MKIINRFKGLWGISIFLLGGCTFSVHAAEANDALSGKSFALGAIVGFPQFIGLDLAYLGWSSFVPGISFGSAPIQSILSNKISLTPISVNFSLPDTYVLNPNASFNLYSFTLYLKYFFPESNFYLELLLTNLSFGANLGGDLQDLTTGITSYSVINGTAKLSQPILGLGGGFRIPMFSSFFMEGALGAGYFLSPGYSTSVGGTVSSVIGVVPNGEQTFNNAKAQIQSAFDSAIATYKNSIKVLPFAFINLGFMF